jgi:hypothetical protein
MALAAAGAHADLSYCKWPLTRQDGGMDSHDRLARARVLVERAKAAMLHTQRLLADWRLRKLERERLLKAVRRTSDEVSRKLW